MSLYDLDDAVGGEQPVGFDQFSGLYANYSVKDFSVTFTYENSDNSARYITLLPSPTSTNPRSLSNTLALPYVVSALCPAKGSGVNIMSITLRMSAFQLYQLEQGASINPRVLADTLWPVGTNPS